jgi:signal transduction histidine kinase
MSASGSNFFKSVRFRFLAWYMVVLTITLLAFSSVLYGGFSKILYGDLDDLLSSKADGIANAIDTYWDAKTGIGLRDAPGAADFTKTASEWMEAKRKDPELMGLFSQILDVNGTKLVSSSKMPRLKQISKEDLDNVLKGEDSFDMLDGETLGGKKAKFRVYTRPVSESGKMAYVVQVAGPVTLVSLALNNLMFVLFVLLPLTILLAGIPGILLARLTLKPVDRMIDTLRQITAENLKLKIHIPDTKDEIRRLADTFNDMIDRLDRSFSSQRRFIQDISYELKTPMGELKKDFEKALAGDLSQKECKDILSAASRQIDDFSRKIENLMFLSSFDNNQIVLHIKKLPLGRLAKAALDDMKAYAAEKDLDVSFSCHEDVFLDGDEAQLRRLLLNIYDNAIKYTYRKGKVSVNVCKDGKNAKLYINDTGIGIPEDEQGYIFDRFYQVGGSRISSRGFGLGLSSARSIVEAHKGDISVESQPGKGSTFTITLPLSYPE